MAHEGWIEECDKIPDHKDLVLRAAYSPDLWLGYYENKEFVSIKQVQCKKCVFWKEIYGPLHEEFFKMGT
jgi:hypothetical protein